MFESIMKFFKRIKKSEKEDSKNTAKERLHLVLAQDRANISADFLELMKQEILEVIKKYIDIDEKEIDVRLTNKEGEDGALGAPALYANIPIITIKNEARKLEGNIERKVEKNEIQNNDTIKVDSQNKKNIDENNSDTNQPEKDMKEEMSEGTAIQEEQSTEQNIDNDEKQNYNEDTNKDNVNEVDDEEKNS